MADDVTLPEDDSTEVSATTPSDDLNYRRQVIQTHRGNILAMQHLDKLQKALEARMNPQPEKQLFDPMWLKIAGGLLAPTKTGSFGESVGYAATGASEEMERQRKEKQELAKQNIQDLESMFQLQKLRNEMGKEDLASIRQLQGQDLMDAWIRRKMGIKETPTATTAPVATVPTAETAPTEVPATTAGEASTAVSPTATAVIPTVTTPTSVVPVTDHYMTAKPTGKLWMPAGASDDDLLMPLIMARFDPKNAEIITKYNEGVDKRAELQLKTLDTPAAKDAIQMGFIPGSPEFADYIRQRVNYDLFTKANEMVQQWETAKAKDHYKGTLQDWILSQKNAGRNIINVNAQGESEYYKTLGKAFGEKDAKTVQAGQDAIPQIRRYQDMQANIDKGMITGTGATALTQFGQVLVSAGLADKNVTDKVQNTQTWLNNSAKATLDNVKASGLGSGNGFTDKDRQFLQDAVSGSIEWNKGTLLRLYQVQEAAARAAINKHNDFVDTLDRKGKNVFNLEKINQPDIYMPEAAKPKARLSNPVNSGKPNG